MVAPPDRHRKQAWQRAGRLLYAGYIVYAVGWIPLRTAFVLHDPGCIWAVTPEGIALSMTKVWHIGLFAGFFLMTAMQFTRRTPRNLAWTAAATLLLGFIIELEEGATGTGACRMRDLFPDAAGALIGWALVAVWARLAEPKRQA